MILLIGLGNPGSEYFGTRHNIGHEIMDLVRDKLGATPWKKRFDSLFSEANVDNTNVLLVRPLTFMNLSGVAAKKFVDYYKLQPSDVLIVSDDLSLPVGTVRLKRRTGSGGHNGLKSIQNALGAEMNVIKIGVGHPGTKEDVIGHVLGRFGEAEHLKITEAAHEAIDQISNFITALSTNSRLPS